MMEGEPGTPVVVRVPDEETAFVGRKVEAPKRRQRLQQQQAQRKRVAVVAVSIVMALAVGAVCVFLPSGAPDEVKTAVSQAMASDPAGASVKKVFVPSFSVYDEDRDGKVTLGEYLDRLAINRDAALQHVDDSDLDETEKTRITDLLNEAFGKHWDCVTLIAQEHEDDWMTEQDFDDKYKEITEFCPTDDERIPDSYQLKEIAEGHEELVDGEESASASASKSEPEWNPEKPTAPPRPVTDSNDAKPEHGIADSKPSEDKPWRPSYPMSPPTPSSTDPKTNEWNPNEPSDPPQVASTHYNGEESAGSPSERKDPTKTGIGDDEWNPTYPTRPPDPSTRKEDEPDKKVTDDESPRNEPYPEGAGQESPYGEQANPDGEQATGAHNAYTGATPDNGAYNAFTSGETGANGENPRTESFPEGAGQESPYGEQANPDGEQATGAHNAYTGATPDNGAYNAFTSGETGANGENPRTESFPEGAGQESPYGEQANPDGEQATGAHNAYTGATPDNGAYNAFTSGETGAYGENPREENLEPGRPEGTAQEPDNSWRQLRGRVR
ncbi:hypothetical protein V7S43_012647 [Phytophthora oleae]|uniref:EF-hand domain-containing protein n=1 Tax=Phytophthora oleae TaxID=2107226 RepID=A0ABD3FA04_9STRA